MLPWRALSLAAWIGASVAKLRVHDETFQPDYVLEAREVDYDINCGMRRSVAINGTIPGPAIHLREGKTTWIRVYNWMEGKNLTMVRPTLLSRPLNRRPRHMVCISLLTQTPTTSTGTASANARRPSRTARHS